MPDEPHGRACGPARAARGRLCPMGARRGTGSAWAVAVWGWVRRLGQTWLFAAVAAYASYEHQRDFARQGGVDPVGAALWPLSVDGLLLLATVELLKSNANIGRGRRTRYTVWTAASLGIAVSLAANIVAAPAGTAAFIVMTSWRGEFTDDYFPAPAAFGMPTEEVGTRGDPLLSGWPWGGQQLPAGRRRAHRGADAGRDRSKRGDRGHLHWTHCKGDGPDARSAGDGVPEPPRRLPRRRVRLRRTA